MVKQTFSLKNVSFPHFPFGGAEAENKKKLPGSSPCCHMNENYPGFINPYVQCTRLGQVSSKGRFFTEICFCNLHLSPQKTRNK